MTDRKRPPLSRTEVVRAALHLVDRDGPRALTFRNLGRELGVEAMSIYHHVRDREDLLDELASMMVSAELPIPPAGQTWEAALREFVVGVRRAALRHPGAFHLVGLRPLRNPSALTAVVGLLEKLSDGGFTPEQAVTCYRVAAAYARGFALAEIAGLTLSAPKPTDEAPEGNLEPFLSALSADTEAVFERGIGILVAGAQSCWPGDRGQTATICS